MFWFRNAEPRQQCAPRTRSRGITVWMVPL